MAQAAQALVAQAAQALAGGGAASRRVGVGLGLGEIPPLSGRWLSVLPACCIDAP